MDSPTGQFRDTWQPAWWGTDRLSTPKLMSWRTIHSPWEIGWSNREVFDCPEWKVGLFASRSIQPLAWSDVLLADNGSQFERCRGNLNGVQPSYTQPPTLSYWILISPPCPPPTNLSYFLVITPTPPDNYYTSPTDLFKICRINIQFSMLFGEPSHVNIVEFERWTPCEGLLKSRNVLDLNVFILS